jgi:hypothetical protein
MNNRCEKPVTDSEADASLKPLESLDVEVASEFMVGWPLQKAHNGSAGRADQRSDGLSVSELRLIKAVVKYPMRASSEYPKLAGISPNTLQKIRPGLIEKGLIREHKLESGTRGRSTILLEPLAAAIELASDQNNQDNHEK